MVGGPNAIRVLHVDDDPEFAAVAAEFVQRHADVDVVDTATGAAAALERLADDDVDCVVSDYDMPGRDGIELLEAVRDVDPDLPFVLYTGKGSEEVASRAISAGVTDYLQKGSGTSQYELLANRIENAVEQHRYKRAIAETEEQLRALARNTDDVLWQFTGDWSELLFVNEAYEDIWGRPTADLHDEPLSFLEAVHPDDRDTVREAMEALSAGEAVDLEVRVNEAEAYGRWVWIRGDAVVDDDGEVTMVGGFVRDVTERRERERKLREAYESYEALIEASPVPIWVQGIEEIRYANEAAADLHGVADAAALVGRSALAFVPEDEHDHARERNERMLEEGEPVEQATGTVVTDDGERRRAVFAGAPITYHGEWAIAAIARELSDGDRA
jgi:PAS domain S-box-containing protein